MKRILLVDDDESFRRAFSEILVREGYQVQTAPEGARALKLCKEFAFELVITDLVMPGKEGIETIMELRRTRPGLKIIAISGGGRLGAEDYLPMAKFLGANEVLAKPFTPTEILDVIATSLSEAR